MMANTTTGGVGGTGHDYWRVLGVGVSLLLCRCRCRSANEGEGEDVDSNHRGLHRRRTGERYRS